MITHATKYHNIATNMVWGCGVPGPLGYIIPYVFSMVNKHNQFCEIVIQTTKSQSNN